MPEMNRGQEQLLGLPDPPLLYHKALAENSLGNTLKGMSSKKIFRGRSRARGRKTLQASGSVMGTHKHWLQNGTESTVIVIVTACWHQLQSAVNLFVEMMHQVS